MIRRKGFARKAAKIWNLTSGKWIESGDELEVAFDPLPVQQRGHGRVEDVVDGGVAAIRVGGRLKKTAIQVLADCARS